MICMGFSNMKMTDNGNCCDKKNLSNVSVQVILAYPSTVFVNHEKKDGKNVLEKKVLDRFFPPRWENYPD